MDPITHGLLGMTIAQSILAQPKKTSVWLLGAAAGMAPDLDVFIYSEQNPLLQIVFHRNFTHSFLFAPLGALLVLLVFLKLRWFRENFKIVYLATLLAYLSHLLIDAATSYGTLLYWPFSRQRVAWDTISIIDPFVTLPLIFGLIWYRWNMARSVFYLILPFIVLYFGFGWAQRTYALSLQESIANNRGHVLERGRVLPTLGNLIAWDSIYETSDRLYLDRIYIIPFFQSQIREQGYVPRLTSEELQTLKIQEDPLKTFAWFSDGYMAVENKDPLLIGDMRYTIRQEQPLALWGIEWNPQQPNAFSWRVRRVDRAQYFVELWNDLGKVMLERPLQPTQ